MVGLILLPLFFLPQVIQTFFLPASPNAQGAIGIVQVLIFYFLLPVAVYRARRYRLTRTQWRGIRGAQTESAGIYAVKVLAYLIFNVLTLTLAIPYFATKLAGYRLNNTWLGDQKLEFQGRSGPLYKSYLTAVGMFFGVWILAILLIGGTGVIIYVGAGLSTDIVNNRPTPDQLKELVPFLLLLFIPVLLSLLFLQVPLIWFSASKAQYFTAQTRLLGASFELRMNRWAFVWLVLSNEFMALLSLGLLLPYVYRRYAQFVTERLMILSELDVENLLQSMREAPKTGEGLADVRGNTFDVGGFGA